MSKYLLSLLAIIVVGCLRDPEGLGLSREILSKLDASQINEICILSVSERSLIYRYNFSINDPEKINVILRYIREATQITNRYSDKPMRSIEFKTRKAVYRASIGWDAKTVYGNWTAPAYDSGGWESAELLEKFKEWNLFEEIAAADPNLPPPKWITNPPKFEDTMPPMPIILGKNNIYLSEEVFSTLNPSKIAKIMIITISGVDPADLKKNIFSITDTETIENIMRIIATAGRNPPTFRGSNIVFEIEDTFYYTGITWDDKAVFGDWWESEKLFTLLSSLIPLSEQE
jgi:hypothetical protein